MDTTMIRIISGVLAVIVLAILIFRMRKKTVH
jgi:hypothetical protein